MSATNDLFERITLSDRYLVNHQDADGAWRVAPDARVLENGLALLLCRNLLSDSSLAAATETLRGAVAQSHCSLAASVDNFLLSMTLSHGQTSVLDMTTPDWQEPATAHRRIFFAGLGYALNWNLRGAPTRASVEATLRAAIDRVQQREMKKWTVAECCALLILLGHSDAQFTALIVEAQDTQGSFGLNPLSTAIVVAALGAARSTLNNEGLSTLNRGVAFLEGEIERYGSWRFATAEVWDTALMLRTLAERRWSLAPSLARATDFIIGAQNADGGWPYREGVESDTDTTGMASFALRAHASSPMTNKAVAYLASRRTEEGLWRTWHDSEDPPAEDAIAHAVLALNALGRGDLCDQARDWLVAQCKERQGWTAHWYNSEPYSAAEIGAALGRQHPMTRYVANLVLSQQQPDGGWSARKGTSSTAAATGMALALLAEFLAWDDERVEAGMGFIYAQQAPDGRFMGATDMYAPRPFAVDYAMQTHALVLTGLTRWANKLIMPVTRGQRISQRSNPTHVDYLSVDYHRASTKTHV